MPNLRISKLNLPTRWAGVSRYGLAAGAVGVALVVCMILRHYRLPHPFTSFSMAAIAVTYWFGGVGSGVVALLLSFLAMGHFFVPSQVAQGVPSESYLIIYVIFGSLVSWYSISRRRAKGRLPKRAILWKSGSQRERPNFRNPTGSYRKLRPTWGVKKID